MSYTRYTREEQETVIRCDGTASAPWEIYSCVPRNVRKLKELAEVWDVEYTEPHEGGIIISLPMKAVSFRKPSTRTMTAEQKQAASERFKQMWADRAEDLHDEEYDD